MNDSKISNLLIIKMGGSRNIRSREERNGINLVYLHFFMNHSLYNTFPVYHHNHSNHQMELQYKETFYFFTECY